MLKTVKMNFKRKEEYAANMYKCTCGEDDFQSHLFTCSSYTHLRDGLDLEGSDHDLVRFFQLVIREHKAEEERTQIEGRGSNRNSTYSWLEEHDRDRLMI